MSLQHSCNGFQYGGYSPLIEALVPYSSWRPFGKIRTLVRPKHRLLGCCTLLVSEVQKLWVARYLSQEWGGAVKDKYPETLWGLVAFGFLSIYDV